MNTTIDMMQCLVNASTILLSCEINDRIIVMPFTGYVRMDVNSCVVNVHINRNSYVVNSNKYWIS